MRKPVILIGTNGLILVAIFALLAQSFVVAQKVARPVNLKGLVEVQSGGKGSFAVLQPDADFKVGDVVRTGAASSAEFRWLDGTRVKLMPNSVLALRKATYHTVRKTEESDLNLTQGKLFVRLVKPMTEGSKFEVHTPAAIASVRGTVFSVEADAGQTEVAVYRGTVGVRLVGGSASKTVYAINAGHEYTLVPYGNVRRDSPLASADFEAEPTISKPQLDVAAGQPMNGQLPVSVVTESGDKVTIDGQPAQEVATGVYAGQVKLTGKKQSWTVVSTDKHGLTSTAVKDFVPESPASPKPAN